MTDRDLFLRLRFETDRAGREEFEIRNGYLISISKLASVIPS